MEYLDKLSYNMPVWSRIDDVPTQFAWLDEDVECEICVVGGGVTGALCAMELAEDGHDVLMITDGAVGMGETARMAPCAVTDMGQNVVQMRRRLGEEQTAWMLNSAKEQLDRLEKLYGTFRDEASRGGDIIGDMIPGEPTVSELYDFGFSRRDCFLYCDNDSENELLAREYAERRRLHDDCVFTGRSAARDMFPFETAGGLILRQQAAVLDPYRLTHNCLRRAMEAGARVYENTKALRIDSAEDFFGDIEERGWLITTGTHRLIDCERVVVAAGEACGELIDGVSAPRTRYTVVSHTLRGNGGWAGQCVLRTFSAYSPELTMATSPDGRIFACGRSSSVMDEHARFAGVFRLPSVHEKRFAELEAGARYLYADRLREDTFEFAQAARECRTADGMPIAGEIEGQEGCIFAVPGGGGVLMSMLCARTAADICGGAEQPQQLSPQRRSLRARSA